MWHTLEKSIDGEEIGADGNDNHGESEAEKLEYDMAWIEVSEMRHGDEQGEGVWARVGSRWDNRADIGLFLRVVVLFENGLLGADDAARRHDGLVGGSGRNLVSRCLVVVVEVARRRPAMC